MTTEGTQCSRLASFAMAVGLCVACGSPSTNSSFSTDRHDLELGDISPTLTTSAHWRYRSPKVDVDLELVTTTAGEDCSTTGKLVVDKLTASPTTYRKKDLDCRELRLSDDGDIILYDRPTGHDWSEEELDVHTGPKTIGLGPWSTEAGEAISFTLSAPGCGRCDCPQLSRSFGAETDILPLERNCD